MDSKVVNCSIKANVWLALKENGFSHFTSRSAWRFHADRIDVVNFQSFNSYNASVIGCTTFSFAVNLGCYLLCIPYQYGAEHLKENGGRLLPDEAQCQMRRQIQPRDERSLVERLLARKAPKGIWPIDESGSNLTSTFEEVRSRLLDDGLQWFSRFAQPKEVLRIFTSESESMGELWGFGNNPSPHRSYCIGYSALSQGEHELALTHLNSALASGCYSSVKDQLHSAVRAAQQIVPADR